MSAGCERCRFHFEPPVIKTSSPGDVIHHMFSAKTCNGIARTRAIPGSSEKLRAAPAVRGARRQGSDCGGSRVLDTGLAGTSPRLARM